MDLQNLFYLTAILSLGIITAGFVYLVFKVIAALKSLQEIVEKAREISADIKVVADSLKLGFLTLTSKFLGKVVKGGESDGGKSKKT
jgi:hypothetical protein